MFQFEKFPVYVVYSKHSQQAVRPLWQRYYHQLQAARQGSFDHLISLTFGKTNNVAKAFDYAKEIEQKNKLIDAVFAWDLQEDIKPKYAAEILCYENEIRRLLTLISSTKIGRMLLNQLCKTRKIWIIPFLEPPISGKAITFPPMSEANSGAIRIFFSPESLIGAFVSKTEITDIREETLFHELVHAYRYSTNRFFQKVIYNPNNFGNSEEFLAAQLENIYHSVRRRVKHYSQYTGEYVSKKEMYQIFVESAELITVLKYLLQTDPLVQQVATLKKPEYNPFRDYKELEKKSLEYYGLDGFADF